MRSIAYNSNRWLHRLASVVVIALLCCGLSVGCRQAQPLHVWPLVQQSTVVPTTQPTTSGSALQQSGYTADDFYAPWEATLARVVSEDGLVAYAALQENHAELDYFLLQVAQVGPASCPSLFADRQQRTAYYLNVYNAWAMRAALAMYPLDSVYDKDTSTRGQFRTMSIVRVDGCMMSLAQLETKLLEVADDPRVLFAINAAAWGEPLISRTPYMAATINTQLHQAVRRSLRAGRGVYIDHEKMRLEISGPLARHRDWLVHWHMQRYGLPDSNVYNTLLAVCDWQVRQQLNRAVGYKIVETTAETSLNDTPIFTLPW